MRAELLVLIAALLPTTLLAADGTALGELAEGMPAGSWAELGSSTGLDAAAGGTGGSSGHILTYSEEAKWNPASREIFFIGGDHNGGPQRFISYQAETNAWTVEDRPPWMPDTDNQNHAYDYMGIDVERQHFYYYDRRYDIAAGTWTDLSPDGFPYDLRGNSAFEYFPAVGFLITGFGGVSVYDEAGSQWQTIHPQGTVEYTSLHSIAEYSPPANLLIFGGGDDEDRLYLLDAEQNITPLDPAPLTNISTSPRGVLLSHDPVSGRFLFIDADNHFYELDALADTWVELTAAPPPFPAEDCTNDLVAVPVSNYGVVVFVHYRNSGSTMHVYKHSPSEPDTLAPAPPTALAVQ